MGVETSPPTKNPVMSLLRRAVRVRLQGGRTITGRIHIIPGQSLVAFLSSKQIFLNLTEARWDDGDADRVLPHVSIRMTTIVWVEPLEDELHLTTAALPSEEARRIELHVEGGVRLEVQLNVAPETRMSDYLDANTAFLPIWSARSDAGGDVIGRVALNHRAIHLIRELEATDPKAKI